MRIIMRNSKSQRQIGVTRILGFMASVAFLLGGFAENSNVQAGEVLERAYQVADSDHTYIRGILVATKGRVISERYFHGALAGRPQNMKSLTKSVTSALIGVAIKEGFIESVDQRVDAILPEYFEDIDLPGDFYSDLLVDRGRVEKYREQLTIRHLLSMTSGIYSFQKSFMFGFGHVDDIAAAYLGLPYSFRPGEKFQYSTAGAHVLSRIIERATGLTTRKFAQKYLFDPLDINIADWKVGPQGHALGGTGLYLTARDLAKFGQLYLDNGIIGNRRIFPDGWVAESLEEQAQVFPPAHISYGYLWWRRAGNPATEDYFFASGTGGQFIFLLPKHDLMVVVSSDPDVPAEESSARGEVVQGFAEQYLLYPLSASE
jgi:CubicO group peptidase (beta-lactamase class C family)